MKKLNVLTLNSKNGFSLLELLVVVSIVSVLVAVGVPAYKSYVNRAKLAHVYSMVDPLIALWVNINSTGDWFSWGTGDSRYPVSDLVEVDSIYINYARVALTFTPGYFNRQTLTTVQYIPVLDGVQIDPGQDAHQLDNAKTISWVCDVSGVDGAYYGDSITTLQFQEEYFPACTCLTC